MAASIVVGTNSYETEVEADAILEEYVHADAWGFALNKVQAIITAFYDISSFVLTDPSTGIAVNPASAPEPIKRAQALLAFDLSQKPALATANGVGGVNVKQVKSGSAGVTFFRPEDKSRFPTLVGRLLAPYLVAADSGIQGSCSSGTDGVSAFEGDGGQLTEGYK